MIFVDTGFFLAIAQPRDELHGRALAWAKGLAEPLLVTEYVLWETVNALSAVVDRPKAHQILIHVRSAGNYEIVAASPALFEAGIQLHAERRDKEWSLTDCLSFLVMQERAMRQALAYDRHFEQAGFDPLLRRDPA
jgi:predicted nucleic acid-binding protein